MDNTAPQGLSLSLDALIAMNRDKGRRCARCRPSPASEPRRSMCMRCTLHDSCAPFCGRKRWSATGEVAVMQRIQAVILSSHLVTRVAAEERCEEALRCAALGYAHVPVDTRPIATL